MAFNTAKSEADQLAAGKWVEFNGGRFKIAMVGNPLYHRAVQRLREEYKEKYGDRILAPGEHRMDCYAMAEGLLRDWEDFPDEDGNSIPYSVDVAARELEERLSLNMFVAETALEFDKQYKEGIKGQAKKPKTPSGTT